MASEILDDISDITSVLSDLETKPLVKAPKVNLFKSTIDFDVLSTTSSSSSKSSKSSKSRSTAASIEADNEFFQQCYEDFMPKIAVNQKNSECVEFSKFLSVYKNIISKTVTIT